MRPITFKTLVRGSGQAEVVEITGFPTATPGLVVHEAYRGCGRVGEDWMVTHARSGLVIPRCWPSPEGALAFANDLGQFNVWQQDAITLRRTFRSVRARRVVAEYAARHGGRTHSGVVVTKHAVLDNGVIA